ncbi:MAG: acetyl-CoA carboxylase biotin carboxyl carrier protein subunit [Rhodopseudomonas palustris]|uniref:Acetyl-CoA carboxylase biotin carboxyl carrier protein subunit n=1 Tax=Rhodopseudomonas palustris TaxID=1076 RepID=A0A933W497_RHOPL|nr:acetyl-CoA carboxylase biotin carboxyl carrier protein subunit [Rhodopseudomonas palustris]
MVEVRAEFVGTVVSVDCAVDLAVELGAPLLSIESMKMEYPIVSSAKGRVSKVCVNVGDVVEENQVLVSIRL